MGSSTSSATRCRESSPPGSTSRLIFFSRGLEALLDAEWREVRVVTDHGWLWLPGGLPKVRSPEVPDPEPLGALCAIQGGSTVDAPTVPWHWNASERVAVGPGIACFWAGNAYAHGGVSLQESWFPSFT